MARKGRPGVMLYFDVRPSLKRLSLEEKGQLFEGILNYAEFGEVPDFEGVLGVAWDFMQPRIDRDLDRYNEISQSRSQAAQKRWDKSSSSSMQKHANASFAMQTMPTTTTTSTTTSSSTSTPTPTSTPTGEEKTPEMKFEDLRKTKIDAFMSATAKGDR